MIAVGRVLYLKFIGARAFEEGNTRGLIGDRPLALVESDLVIDCDEKAWDDGVRPGDTLRQAKISSPACRIAKVVGSGGERLTRILDIMADLSPYVEPAADQIGVFVDIPVETDISAVLDSLKGLFFKVFAAASSSKLISRAACDLFMKERVGRARIFPGKTKWGFLRQEDDRVVASIDSGKEKAFISGAPLDSLWMAPPEIVSMLRSLGLKKVRDLQEVTVSQLAERAGDWASMVKKWAEGEDRSRVRALYPPPSLAKEVSLLEPAPIQKSMFDKSIKELAVLLMEKGIGFKTINLSLFGFGDFGPFSGNPSGERKFARPVCSAEAMKAAVSAILDGILEKISVNGPPAFSPLLSGFRLKLEDLAPVRAAPSPLLDAGYIERPKVVPVGLGLTLFGLEGKFGDRAVAWGKGESLREGFTPEIARREKMLSVWDPMRLQSFDQAAAQSSAGGVADV